MFVYFIVNQVNGKYYVGKTKQKDLQKYWRGQRWMITHPEKAGTSKPHLYNAVRKYGWRNFSIHPLITDCKTDEELLHWEQVLIKALGSQKYGYNLCAGGRGVLGWKHTEESKKKISEKNKGKKRTAESVAKMKAILAARRQAGTLYIPPHTPESIAKRVATRRINGNYQENLGRKNTLETIEKMKTAALNRDPTPYIGLKRSPEAIENLRKGALNRVASESLGTRQKRAAACSSTLSLKYGAKRDEAIRLRETGLSYSTIATELGVSYKAARLWSLGQSTYKPKSKV